MKILIKIVVAIYLLLALVFEVWLLYGFKTDGIHIDKWFLNPAVCSVLGGLGGCVYCLRGFYLNIAVNKSWGDEWLSWYFVRPVISLIFGGVSYLFVNAGLIFLDAQQAAESNGFGIYCLAFLAGLNVDKFLVRIEGIGMSIWGLEQSRQSSNK